ncbi:AtpZ/AtpI family protein [Chelatococcus composti]|uniref:ATP synthase protein I n=1 Tax=Chelatococcus composti TaxID=1743235 RepID=A0A841K8W1_9HYPH|nr:AtpZ/AtpI family protein [Chelatococcus composti]MBB6168540.1 ATP synthase protein I [Chelatococcus composti]MBS7736381.1 AtpZ/AtpI family protein [Chelatococcus composti]PZN44091.1 MAG: ATP F0F1 synthase subunit I [Pseudomonadota bacterium]GGG40909.1 ATP synthase protein I [Chelatococcus composti]
MAKPDERKDGTGKPADGGTADLSARLRHLDEGLRRISANQPKDAEPASGAMSNQSALGQVFRLSAEFVSGVIAGGLLGWIIDRLAGTAPWGLVVCLLLGFCAGMLNLARASGALPGWGGKSGQK